MDAPPSAWTLRLAVVVLCIVWGSAWVVVRDGLDTLPPLFSAGVRFVIAGAFMAALAPWARRREGGTDPPAWLWLLVATTNFAIGYGIVYSVQQVLPSGLVSLLWAVYPVLMVLGAHFILDGERLGALQWLGFLLGFLGVAALFGSDVDSLGPTARRYSALLLLSPAATAAGTLTLKRHGSQCSSVVLNRNAMLFGGALLLLAALISGEALPSQWGARTILGMLYLALFGSVLTLGLYYWVLRHGSASRLSLTAYATPAIALSLGWVVRDEPIYASTVVGALLIAGGIAVANTRSDRDRDEDGLAPDHRAGLSSEDEQPERKHALLEREHEQLEHEGFAGTQRPPSSDRAVHSSDTRSFRE